MVVVLPFCVNGFFFSKVTVSNIQKFLNGDGPMTITMEEEKFHL